MVAAAQTLLKFEFSLCCVCRSVYKVKSHIPHGCGLYPVILKPYLTLLYRRRISGETSSFLTINKRLFKSYPNSLSYIEVMTHARASGSQAENHLNWASDLDNFPWSWSAIAGMSWHRRLQNNWSGCDAIRPLYYTIVFRRLNYNFTAPINFPGQSKRYTHF